MSNITDNLLVKFLVVLIAMFSPFVCIFLNGELNSYSEYWSTDYRPIFIFTNAATSYFLFSMRNWWFPALFLVLLTAFSHDQYFWTHNITAILFFVSSAISILKSRRYQFYAIPYFSSVIILLLFGILWAEVLAITIISTFHLHRLLRLARIESRRKV